LSQKEINKGEAMTKILVVDDDHDLRDDLAWAAKKITKDVLEADGSEVAIRKIHEIDFDVIVTDLHMESEKAGLEVLKAAKQKDIYTQVILVTAWGTPEISVETMRLGAFDYLERNAPDTNFLEMVRSKIKLANEFRNSRLYSIP